MYTRTNSLLVNVFFLFFYKTINHRSDIQFTALYSKAVLSTSVCVYIYAILLTVRALCNTCDSNERNPSEYIITNRMNEFAGICAMYNKSFVGCPPDMNKLEFSANCPDYNLGCGCVCSTTVHMWRGMLYGV